MVAGGTGRRTRTGRDWGRGNLRFSIDYLLLGIKVRRIISLSKMEAEVELEDKKKRNFRSP